MGYSPTLGRFIQPDTIVPSLGDQQMLNRYSYVGNNPINYIDPTGHVRVENSGGGGNTVSPKKNATTTNYVVEKKIAKADGREKTISVHVPPTLAGSGGNNRSSSNSSNSNSGGSSTSTGVSTTFQLPCGSFITALEGSTCSNVNQASRIVTNPNASPNDRFWSGYYVTVVANVHVGLAVGLGIIAWEGAIALGSTCILNPQCADKVSRIITNDQITGSKSNPINIEGFKQTLINGVTYSGHAVDRLIENDIPPSVIQGALEYSPVAGNTGLTQVFYDPVNNIRVIQNVLTEVIVTLGYGIP